MDGYTDDVVDLESTELDALVSPDVDAWLGARGDAEGAIADHVVTDLDATAKFVETIARVARVLINYRVGDLRGIGFGGSVAERRSRP